MAETIKRSDPRWVCATGGYYLFEDGLVGWYNGLSAWEKKHEIALHGKIVAHSRYGSDPEFAAACKRFGFEWKY